MNPVLLTSCLIFITILPMQTYMSHAVPTTTNVKDVTPNTNPSKTQHQTEQKQHSSSSSNVKTTSQHNKDEGKSNNPESQSETTPSFPSTRSKRESSKDFIVVDEGPGYVEVVRASDILANPYPRFRSYVNGETEDWSDLNGNFDDVDKENSLEDSYGSFSRAPIGSDDLLGEGNLRILNKNGGMKFIDILPDENDNAKRSREFFGKRSDYSPLDKRAREFFGKRTDYSHVDKRPREFFGKRSDYSPLEKRPREFFGKRSREFFGKRSGSFELDKRPREFFGKRSREFFGKRAREFFGKRAREFFGKRSQGPMDKRAREFFGKRSREFFGKRSNEGRLYDIKENLINNLLNDLYKQNALEDMNDDDAEQIRKRAREFFGKRSREFFGKRAREFFGKRSREFFEKRAGVEKRPREFFGKRSSDDLVSKRAREFFGKRAREFFGKRADDDSDFEKRHREFFGKRVDGLAPLGDDSKYTTIPAVKNGKLLTFIAPEVQNSNNPSVLSLENSELVYAGKQMDSEPLNAAFDAQIEKQPYDYFGKQSSSDNALSAARRQREFFGKPADNGDNLGLDQELGIK